MNGALEDSNTLIIEFSPLRFPTATCPDAVSSFGLHLPKIALRPRSPRWQLELSIAGSDDDSVLCRLHPPDALFQLWSELCLCVRGRERVCECAFCCEGWYDTLEVSMYRMSDTWVLARGQLLRALILLTFILRMFCCWSIMLCV